MAEAPPSPPVPQPNGIPKVSAQKPHFHAQNHIYDTICVGFSIVGLGLAVALSDLTLDNLNNILFLERSPHFISKDASQTEHMQSTFAQDLATLRCPTSPFTFLNYLSEKQGLESFLASSNTLCPTREDFGDYIEWAAEQFDDVVMYGEEVVKIEVPNGPGNLWVVVMKKVGTADFRALVCKTVVFATGREARLAKAPSQITSLERIDGIQMLSVIDQMREFCIGQSREVGLENFLPNLAVHSGKLATSLLFERDGSTTRAAL